MTRYLGTKAVFAEPGNHPKTGVAGYRVVYEDGYQSWSPRDVFEKAYKPAVGMSFPMAIEAMRAGMRVKRAAFPENVFVISVVEGDERIVLEDDSDQYMILFGVEDMAANDWITC